MPFEGNRLLPLVERLSTPLARREELGTIRTRIIVAAGETLNDEDQFVFVDLNSASLALPVAADNDTRVIYFKLRTGASGALSITCAALYETIDLVNNGLTAYGGNTVALVADRGRWFILLGSPGLTAIPYSLIWYVGIAPWLTGMLIDTAFGIIDVRQWYAEPAALQMFSFREFA